MHSCYLCGGMMVKKVGSNIGAAGRRGYYFKCTSCGRQYVPQSEAEMQKSVL